MNMPFASANLTMGQLNATVKMIGGEDATRRFLRGELAVTERNCTWYQHGAITYFSVISDGTTGQDWITRLEKGGFCVNDFAKKVLLSKDFKPTSGIATEVAVLKGVIFEDSRFNKVIRAVASSLKLELPHAEVACLIREKFTDEAIEAMGLSSIYVMHEPIYGSGGYPNLLGAHRRGTGSLFDADRGELEYGGWSCDDGFGFAVSRF